MSDPKHVSADELMESCRLIADSLDQNLVPHGVGYTLILFGSPEPEQLLSAYRSSVSREVMIEKLREMADKLEKDLEERKKRADA